MLDKKSISKTFIFKSSFEELEKLDDCLRSVEGYNDLNEDKQYEIMLVLSEAVTNAMEHGNKLNANKTVKLSITMSAESTTAEVYDEGPGFNPEELVNPLGQDEMLRDHGRGWFLMQHYSSSIEWNDEKKCLTIHF